MWDTFYRHTAKLYTDGQLTANIPACVTCRTRGQEEQQQTLSTSYVWPVPLPDNDFIIRFCKVLQCIKR